MGPAERAAGNALQAGDFVEGIEVGVGLNFVSVFKDLELSARLSCVVFENDRAVVSELLGAERADPTKLHRRCNNDEDVAIKILTGH